VSHTVVNFKTSKDCLALDWQEAQEFKYRASLHVGGHLIVEEIERGIDGHTTVDLADHRRLEVDILDAWIQQAERVETLSSELWDLLNQLSEDELELRRPTHSQLESSRSRTVTSPKPRRKKSNSSRVLL
jgi:hypothetical protein